MPPPPEESTDFQTLYAENCTACHGENGKGGAGRILNDPLYLALIPKETLKQVIEDGRPGTAMPPWAQAQGGPLSPKQIDALVNGIESWAKPIHAHLPSYSAAIAGNEGNGNKLFAKDCFMCHGPGGPVGSVTDPSYLSLVTDQLLRTSIIVGRPDFGMPDYRVLNQGRPLADQDVSDLVAYLSSQRPPQAALEVENEGNVSPQQGGGQNETGTGQSGVMTKGNEGSGYGPGSPRQKKNEGNKATGGSSFGGGK